MSILGLKTLPRNHPLHRLYEVSAGVVGVILVVFGALGLILSRDRIGYIAMTTAFCIGCIVVGAVLIVGGIIGGNVAAQVNAWTGAALLVVGLAGLMLARRTDVIEISDVMVMFVVGMILLAAGFYGQVGEVAHGDRTGARGSRAA